MSGYIDLDYISKIQPRLQQFKKKRDYLYNFRCPVCGDSKKSKTKARAYLYRVKTEMFFKCHNCGSGLNLANLIKLVDRPLYDQYVLERYKGNKPLGEANLLDKFKNNNPELILEDYFSGKVEAWGLFHDRFRYFLVGETPDPIAEALGLK